MNGELLRKIRKLNNLTQKEVAENLKMPRSTYNSYEQGLSDPSVETIINLSKLFNTSTDNLLGAQRATSPQRNELLEIIDRLTDTECRKLFNYAEGIIMNRQAEQRQNQLRIFEDEE